MTCVVYRKLRLVWNVQQKCHSTCPKCFILPRRPFFIQLPRCTIPGTTCVRVAFYLQLVLTALQVLKPACVNALKRIFKVCDKNKDGVLDSSELNDFQVC